MQTRLNVELWNEERLALEEKIIALKAQMRATGHFISWEESKQLLALKKDATRLYSIRAESRNRIHIQRVVAYGELIGFSGFYGREVRTGSRKQVIEKTRADQRALIIGDLPPPAITSFNGESLGESWVTHGYWKFRADPAPYQAPATQGQ